MNVNEWLNNLKGDDSMRTASMKSGYAQTTLQRQIDKAQLSPEMVISLCRAYGRSPITGLIENGYIYPHEVEGPEVEEALDRATNQQLLDEILRRSDPEARYLFGADEDTIGLADGAEVFELPTSGVDAGSYDGTVKEFDWSQPHAADSSTDEQAEREKRGEEPID